MRTNAEKLNNYAISTASLIVSPIVQAMEGSNSIALEEVRRVALSDFWNSQLDTSEVSFGKEVTWEERDMELRKYAVCLE